MPTIPRDRRRRRPLRYADVFLDDEILVAQGDRASLNTFQCKLLHLNDRVFRPNDAADDPSIRREPLSLKKLDKSDACWATRKIVLGWLVNTLKGTIELPPHRRDRLSHILATTLASRRVSTKAWHKLLGELCSMVLGIPGGHGLFSQLQSCPILTTIHRVLFLRAQHLPVTSPLCTYVDSRPTPLTSNHITTLLQEAARSLLTLGFAPTNVNARSLRAGGAMALLCSRVDANTIRLVGRWHSDAMF